jgi:outer membrane biogenesis lipoprotein LolB
MNIPNWVRGTKRKHTAYEDSDDNRPIKIVKDGHNSWRIVYADASEQRSN